MDQDITDVNKIFSLDFHRASMLSDSSCESGIALHEPDEIKVENLHLNYILYEI